MKEKKGGRRRKEEQGNGEIKRRHGEDGKERGRVSDGGGKGGRKIKVCQ